MEGKENICPDYETLKKEGKKAEIHIIMTEDEVVHMVSTGRAIDVMDSLIYGMVTDAFNTARKGDFSEEEVAPFILRKVAEAINDTADDLKVSLGRPVPIEKEKPLQN